MAISLTMAAEASASCTLVNAVEIARIKQNGGASANLAMAGGSTSEPKVDFVPGELIVQFRSTRASKSFAPSNLSARVLESSLDLMEVTDRPRPPGMKVFRIISFGALSTDSLRAETLRIKSELEQREDVDFVDLNYILHAQANEPNDPCYALQWHYWKSATHTPKSAPGGIDLPTAWQTTIGGRRVVVAVVDTGQVYGHSDNDPANLVPGYDMVDLDADPTDAGIGTGYHGTHVAGTVGTLSTDNAGGAASANWQVSVQPVRVLGPTGGKLTDITNGILWAAGLPVEGLPRNETPANIINLSLGGRLSCVVTRSLQSAIDKAHAKGVLVVAAAGNDAVDVDGYTPAGCDNVLTVAAGDANGALTWYSGFGDKVEILAPGGDLRADANGDGMPDGVLSAVKGGFALYQGTSMAAPHVSGMAALLLSVEPGLSPAKILERLQRASSPRSTDQCPKACGSGLLNGRVFTSTN
ncbi:S8 family serine peptidase [Thalassobaculum sp.]|uniref:S8 family serine peptidase n=1 Tax=Thalassobaculum sp. TaxID=2022740 RepID=UPI0032ED71CD